VGGKAEDFHASDTQVLGLLKQKILRVQSHASTKRNPSPTSFAHISVQGLKVSRPSGWNQFDGSPETYVVKWSDIINRDELVVLNSTPVKASTTSVEALGDVQEIGKKLAKGRGAELVEAKARLTEGVLFYEFEFKGEAISELASLCVAKGRLWNLSATAATKRWAKKRDLFKGVIGSFLPKL